MNRFLTMTRFHLFKVRRTVFALILLVGAVGLTGCASSGVFPAASLTETQLASNNYEVVARGVTGEASADYVFGISGSFVGSMSTYALFRIEGEGFLYGEAIENLWANFEDEHGSVEGRSLALTNVRFDSEALNLFVYTRPTVFIRADVVEFTGGQ